MAQGVVKEERHSVIPPSLLQPVQQFSTVWVVAESARSCNYLQSQLQNLGVRQCSTFVASELIPNMSKLLTALHTERPDFVWISSLHHDPLHPLDDKVRVAARLVIAEQHGMGGQFLMENANQIDDGRGVHLSSNWQAMNQRGTIYPVWWCALGLVKPKMGSNRIQNCAYVSVFTSLSVPSTLTVCCSNDKFTGRSVLPSRYPKCYYTAMTSMIHEIASSISVPDPVYKTQKKQKPKPPQPTPEESPGDHADTEFLEKPSKKVEMENTFDDCGDDVSTIAFSDSTSISAFTDSSYFLEEGEDMGEDDQLFNDEFFSWAVTGSTTCPEEPLHQRPNSFRFPSMHAAYATIGHNPRYAGQHDVCEIFGGDAGTTRVCMRRGLKTGPAFDINVGIDLTSSVEIQHLWMYLERYRPKVVIAGPPCTSFGPWSRINRYRAYDTWRKNRTIGEKLAKLIGEVCLFQLQQGRHFIVENPEQSEIWQLSIFKQLLQDKRVAQATMHPCMVGLVDPENMPTKKPTLFIASAESLIKRLRIKCVGKHQHALLAGSALGVSRCKFAQVWPRRLVELIAEGIIETLKSSHKAFPAIDDPYGGAQVNVCPGFGLILDKMTKDTFAFQEYVVFPLPKQ